MINWFFQGAGCQACPLFFSTPPNLEKYLKRQLEQIQGAAAA
jgi:hypothetical protein